MESGNGIPSGKIDNKKDKDIERISFLESKLKNNTSSTDLREMFLFILYRIYGVASHKIKQKGLDHFSQYESFSTKDLLESFKKRLSSVARAGYFDEWVELMNNTRGVGFENKSTNQNARISDDSINGKIKLAQEEQSEIEQDLTHSLFSNNFGLKIEIKRNKDNYGLPEYYILSQKGDNLGIIRFSTSHIKGEEKNILEFARFITNEKEGKGQVILVLSNLEKNKIKDFVKSCLVYLTGKKEEAKVAIVK